MADSEEDTFVPEDVSNVRALSIDGVYLDLYITKRTSATSLFTSVCGIHLPCVQIIKESIDGVLQDATYTHSKVSQWNNAIVETCLRKLTSMNKPFKYIGAPLSIQAVNFVNLCVYKHLMHLLPLLAYSLFHLQT